MKFPLTCIVLCLPFFGHAQSHFKNGGTHRAFISNPTDSSWWRSAVLYEITPHLFTDHPRFRDIEKRLPELRQLGINTVWLQPLFASSEGHQGYDVTDYFRLRPDFGTEPELRHLIDVAHRLGIRVLFDFVANHTSIRHPYAKDKLANGEKSPYRNYYQEKNDNAPYSSQYRFPANGFVTYFWDDLVNLNFDEPKVRAMITRACVYWIDQMNLDGYRFDAAWALNARSPAFSRELTHTLRCRKPSLLLLAEDKGSTGKPYDLGFSAAYDWSPDSSWISHWAWEYDFTSDDSKTIFNHPDSLRRKILLEKALFANDNGHLILRYMENNDTRRFVSGHSLQQTMMVAALLFSLPGLPMLYNGQEVGSRLSPYGRGSIFPRDKPIASLNPSLFAYYQKLIRLRKNHPALRGTSMDELPATNPCTVAILRKTPGEELLLCVNLSDSPVQTVIAVHDPDSKWLTTASFRDLVSEKSINIKKTGNGLQIGLPAFSVQIISPR